MNHTERFNPLESYRHLLLKRGEVVERLFIHVLAGPTESGPLIARVPSIRRLPCRVLQDVSVGVPADHASFQRAQQIQRLLGKRSTEKIIRRPDDRIDALEARVLDNCFQSRQIVVDVRHYGQPQAFSPPHEDDPKSRIRYAADRTSSSFKETTWETAFDPIETPYTASADSTVFRLCVMTMN